MVTQICRFSEQHYSEHGDLPTCRPEYLYNIPGFENHCNTPRVTYLPRQVAELSALTAADQAFLLDAPQSPAATILDTSSIHFDGSLLPSAVVLDHLPSLFVGYPIDPYETNNEADMDGAAVEANGSTFFGQSTPVPFVPEIGIELSSGYAASEGSLSGNDGLGFRQANDPMDSDAQNQAPSKISPRKLRKGISSEVKAGGFKPGTARRLRKTNWLLSEVKFKFHGETTVFIGDRRNRMWVRNRGRDHEPLEPTQWRDILDRVHVVTAHPGGVNGDAVKFEWDRGENMYVGEDKATRRRLRLSGKLVAMMFETPGRSVCERA